MIARGFTLIELLIAISIASILLALVTVSFRNFQSGQELKQIGQTFVTNLRFAQSQAYGGVKPCGNQVLTGWFVAFDENSYRINSRCGNSLGTNPQVVNLPNNMTISTLPDLSLTNENLLFRPINKEIGLINNIGVVRPLVSDQTVTLQKASAVFVITIKKTGDIHGE